MLLVERLAEHIARHLSTNTDYITQFVCSWYMYSWPWAHKRSMCLRLSRSKNTGMTFLYSVQSSVTKCHVTLPCIPKAIFDLCDAWPISCDIVGRGHMFWLKQGVPKSPAVCHRFFSSAWTTAVSNLNKILSQVKWEEFTHILQQKYPPIKSYILIGECNRQQSVENWQAGVYSMLVGR